MAEDKREQLQHVLESFDTGMLITRHDDREHGRPMAVAGVEGSTTLWFVTIEDTPKSAEIRRDPRVSVTFQSDRRFVALSGVATFVHDPAKVREVWRPMWKAWFPRGKDDPGLVLIRVAVTDAEYWDNAGMKGIRFLVHAAKAIVERRRLSPTASDHGRVKASEQGEPLSQQ